MSIMLIEHSKKQDKIIRQSSQTLVKNRHLLSGGKFTVTARGL